MYKYLLRAHMLRHYYKSKIHKVGYSSLPAVKLKYESYKSTYILNTGRP